MRKKRLEQLVIYQAPGGEIELRGDVRKETIWANQAQIAEVFGVERSVITKHINNILRDKELDKKQVCAKFARTAADGKTYQVQHYNLDVILAVGYRTNSSRAMNFRQWATKTLRKHLLKGYTINKSRIAKNYASFMKAVEDVKALLPAKANIETEDVLELIKLFADTWFSLAAYDKGSFGQGKVTKKKKAAHLLYFIVKGHPFVDGNKRSGAFAFIWFLNKAGCLNQERLNSTALTALTLLIAQSETREKEKLVSLVVMLIKS